jgi:hypothetical protein
MSRTVKKCQTILRFFANSRKAAAMAPALTLLLLTIGCQQRSFAEHQWAVRESHIGRTFGSIEAGEQSRDHRLESTLEMIDRVERLHARKNAAWPGRLEAMLQQEVRAWERGRPRVESELSRQMRGRPQEIETTAIRLGI